MYEIYFYNCVICFISTKIKNKIDVSIEIYFRLKKSDKKTLHDTFLALYASDGHSFISHLDIVFVLCHLLSNLLRGSNYEKNDVLQFLFPPQLLQSKLLQLQVAMLRYFCESFKHLSITIATIGSHVSQKGHVYNRC